MTPATVVLARDHDALRASLASIESAIRQGAGARHALLKAAMGLSRGLRDHIRRETQTMVSCGLAMGRFGSSALDCLADEHHEERRFAWLVVRLLRDGGSGVHEAYSVCGLLAIRLANRMARQEARLFPLAAWVLEGEAQAPEMVLSETMGVRQVLLEYPVTRDVFRRLLIHESESDSLREVARRYGIELDELMAQLEEAILEPPLDRGWDESMAPKSSSTTCWIPGGSVR